MKKKYSLLLLLIIAALSSEAQCLTNSIIINTAYNPVTTLAIPYGTDGGTPVPDAKWIVVAESPGIAPALPLTLPYLPSGSTLIEVTPGNVADVVMPAPGGWVTNPPGNPGGWISCVNSEWYYTDTSTDYEMTLGRPFKMCMDDSIKLDLYIANDDWISATNVDGTIPLSFSQPAGLDGTHFNRFTHFTQTVFLTCGTHTVNFVIHNYNFNPVRIPNATGLDVYGTFSSATGLNSIVKENTSSCTSYLCSCAAPTCDSVALPDTIHACSGTTITLPATLYGSDTVLSITWSPATGLSSSTVLNPTLVVGSSGYYGITVRSLFPSNLVVNGDFSAGNTGFTSSYTYVTGPGSLFPEGTYTVTTDPFLEHSGAVSFGDHTTGTGEMMAVNGASTPVSVWCETIPVTPNTDYDFSAWMANWSSADVGAGAPILQFMINGVLLGTPYTLTAAPGVWTNFFTVWNSGTNTSATICIYDENTVAGGNDFALDDISFMPICVSKDSVYIAVTRPDTTSTSSSSTLCISSAPIALSSTPGYTSYLWNTGATTTSILAAVSGTYWVQNNKLCVTKVDTFHVDFIPMPNVFIGNDTAFCIGNTLTLSSPQPPGSVYLWSNGSSGSSIVVSTSGTYWLQVNNGYCTASDTIHVTISPPPIVDLGPDTSNCIPAPVTLQSSITYTSPAYLWSTGGTGPTLTVSTSGTYWLQVTVAGCANADTINVNIYYDTVHLFTTDTALCKGQSLPVFLNLNPSATVEWLPTAGVSNYTVPQPVITADTSAEYRVKISLPGCPDLYDSFYLDIQPNPVLFAGGNRTVCQFDTLHLHASVTPNWYTHYTYTWSPSTYLDDPSKSTVVFTAGLDTKYLLTITTPAGCSAVDSASITVYPGNFAHLDTSITVCPHDSVQLRPTGGVSYRWHPSLYLDDSTSAAPWLRPVTSQSYTIIATSAFGCLDTVYAHVTVEADAHLFLPDSVELYPGQSYHIQPQTNCVYFTWFPAAGLDYTTVMDPQASPQLSTKYTVHGKTEWGCEAVDSISIYLKQTLFGLPNAFTPGAGINNKLTLIQMGQGTLTYFRIFNRWGNMVFETTNIAEGWDGTYKGTPQPYDVYVYEIEATTSEGKSFKKHGNITLIR